MANFTVLWPISLFSYRLARFQRPGQMSRSVFGGGYAESLFEIPEEMTVILITDGQADLSVIFMVVVSKS